MYCFDFSFFLFIYVLLLYMYVLMFEKIQWNIHHELLLH